MHESKPSAMQQIIEALERVESLQIVEAMDDVGAALSAARAMQEQQAGEPAGWRLVPEKMTMRMMAAAGPAIRASVGLDGKNGNVTDVWNAILAASPSAPPVAGDSVQQPVGTLSRNPADDSLEFTPIGDPYVVNGMKLYAAPIQQAAQPSEALRCLECADLVAVDGNSGECHKCRRCWPLSFLRASQTEAQQAAKPVAADESARATKPYAYEFGLDNGDGTYSVVIERGSMVQIGVNKWGYGPPRNPHKDCPVKPLYDAPPSGERPTAPAPATQPDEPVIVMTGYQLRAAAEFVNPDAGDTDQLESKVCIQWGPERDDGEGGKEPAGLRVWLADYPEEGSMYLDPDKPWPPAALATPAPAGAEAQQDAPATHAALEQAIMDLPITLSPLQRHHLANTPPERAYNSGHYDARFAASKLVESAPAVTPERIREIAHRTCTEYRHMERVRYGFAEMHLWEFVRRLEAEHGIGSPSAKEGANDN